MLCSSFAAELGDFAEASFPEGYLEHSGLLGPQVRGTRRRKTELEHSELRRRKGIVCACVRACVHRDQVGSLQPLAVCIVVVSLCTQRVVWV